MLEHSWFMGAMEVKYSLREESLSFLFLTRAQTPFRSKVEVSLAFDLEILL